MLHAQCMYSTVHTAHTHMHTRTHTHRHTHTSCKVLTRADHTTGNTPTHTNTHQHTPTHILTTRTLNTHSAKLQLLNEMLMSTGHGIHKLLSLLPCCGQLFVQANAPHTKRTQQLSESTLTEHVPHKGCWNVCY